MGVVEIVLVVFIAAIIIAVIALAPELSEKADGLHEPPDDGRYTDPSGWFG